jgi:hypothetical protein
MKHPETAEQDDYGNPELDVGENCVSETFGVQIVR